MSNILIKVENLRKKYLIRHKFKDSYTNFKDVISKKAIAIGQRVCHPFNRKHTEPTCEEFWALNGVSFEVEKGEVLGIIGNNGAGKSTLLKILSRITEPTSGRVRIKDRVASLLEVGTGFHPELTGRENIFLNGAILGMTKNEINNKFDEIVAFSNVEKFLDTPVKRYSSGMKVRLGFSVAAHLDPEILLVDEVLAVGDARFKKKCLKKMGDIRKSGRTIIFVSHNLDSIRRLCNKTIRLEAGCIARIGKSDEVIDEYLTEGINTRGGVTFLENRTKIMTLRSISIINHKGEPSASVEKSRGFRVRIAFDVNRPIERANVVCFFLTTGGTIILSTGDADCAIKRFGVRHSGHYIAEFKVPAFLLSEGIYSITVNLAIPFEKIFDRHESVIFFNVIETVKEGPPRTNKLRPGIIGVQLPWKYIAVS